MSSYDAMFLAVAAGLFSRRPKRWWLVGLAPVIAFASGLAPIGEFQIPVAALIACVVAPRFAAPALLMVLPAYASLATALVTGAVWLGLMVLVGDLAERRLDADTVPAVVRGTPARLFALAVLYYTLYPVMFL